MQHINKKSTQRISTLREEVVATLKAIVHVWGKVLCQRLAPSSQCHFIFKRPTRKVAKNR
eukprot:514320-Pelagomonas_calceolata.AAC.3